MAVGQVSFKDQKKVKRLLIPQRENAIVNRLNKTKVEKFPDLRQEKEDRLKELRKKDQAAMLARVRFVVYFRPPLSPRPLAGDEMRFLYLILISILTRMKTQRKEEARITKERQEKKWQKDHAYDELFAEENMAASSNQDRDENWEDDFM